MEIFDLEHAHEEVDHAIAMALQHQKPVYINISCNISGVPYAFHLPPSDMPFSQYGECIPSTPYLIGPSITDTSLIMMENHMILKFQVLVSATSVCYQCLLPVQNYVCRYPTFELLPVPFALAPKVRCRRVEQLSRFLHVKGLRRNFGHAWEPNIPQYLAESQIFSVYHALLVTTLASTKRPLGIPNPVAGHGVTQKNTSRPLCRPTWRPPHIMLQMSMP